MNYGDLKHVLTQAAQKFVTTEEAEYFARECAETEIRKPLTAGSMSSEILSDFETWKNKTKDVEKTIDLPGFTRFNFNGLGPSLKIKEVHDELAKKAHVNGIAMISVVNSAGMHKLHFWTQGLAKRGLFSLGAWNGGFDAVVPFNGTKGIMGTNPITYAFPSDKGDVVVDMATSELAYYKLRRAVKSGSPLPPHAAVNDEGIETTDAAAVIDSNDVSNLLPMGGGYKGYNINYLMEIMTSALVGGLSSAQMNDDSTMAEYGGFIIAIDINKVTDPKQYDASVKAMNEEIRAQKPKNGVSSVIVPGDTNRARMDGVTDDAEIELGTEFKAKLEELAK